MAGEIQRLQYLFNSCRSRGAAEPTQSLQRIFDRERHS